MKPIDLDAEPSRTDPGSDTGHGPVAASGADPRRALLISWLKALPQDPALEPESLRPASSDASFRRYFRIDARNGETRIVMDAPPLFENCRRFVHVAQLFAAAGVTTPAVLAADLESGFLLLTDLGETTYSQALAAAGADAQALYADAIEALIRIQLASRPDELPPYDRERLLTEMRLFPDWYVARHLGVELTGTEQAALAGAFETLLDAALAQPSVYVHRDYHSRNLMRLDGRWGDAANPGILDFQDALHGPVAYDLVSLLRDAYVDWPEERQLDWAIRYWERARARGLPLADDFADFWRDVEWMGLQRSLKVLGIFARLYHRDGKDRYLADLPLVLKHTRRVAERYRHFGALARLLDRLDKRAPQAGYTF